MYRYTITDHLLKLISETKLQVQKLKYLKFSDVVLAEYDFTARAQSSFASTSIEGNPLPLTEVKKILKSQPKSKRQSEIEILNYNEALVWLNQLAKKNKIILNVELILSLHKIVTKNLLAKSKSGHFRNEPVFVNDPIARKTIYWPPDDNDVNSLIKKLVDFINENSKKVDPIILAGIFHKQFVIIHPFIDGNGRTVRLLTKSILALLGIDTFNLFSFENFYNKNVSRYFKFVGVRGNYYDICKKTDFTDWLEYFTEGMADEMYRVEKELLLIQGAKNYDQRLTVDQEKILFVIDKNGSIRDLDYSKITLRAKATRALDFKKLCQLKLIEKKGAGPSTYYVRKK